MALARAALSARGLDGVLVGGPAVVLAAASCVAKIGLNERFGEMEGKLNFALFDVNTDEEIEGFDFPWVDCAPRIGDYIHYWVDGFPDAAGVDSGIKMDFLVARVKHDLRVLPGRGGAPLRVHTVEVWVKRPQ